MAIVVVVVVVAAAAAAAVCFVAAIGGAVIGHCEVTALLSPSPSSYSLYATSCIATLNNTAPHHPVYST